MDATKREFNKIVFARYLKGVQTDRGSSTESALGFRQVINLLPAV